jgi:hypothetical protein
MQINFVGLAATAATFFGVWLGHVSVRKIEREVERIWIPSILALFFGLGLEFASLQADGMALSAFCGILGITLLWDALELGVRQPRRIIKGHAPANPKNPRHARILAMYPTATTVDFLERDPRGAPYSESELQAIKDGKR